MKPRSKLILAEIFHAQLKTLRTIIDMTVVLLVLVFGWMLHGA